MSNAGIIQIISISGLIAACLAGIEIRHRLGGVAFPILAAFACGLGVELVMVFATGVRL